VGPRPDSARIADAAWDGVVVVREVLGAGFRPYERVSFVRTNRSGKDRPQDILRAGRAAAVLPIDLARQEIVLIGQFRLAVHLANGRGNLIEIVAGHVDPHEKPEETARRECIEEIGLAPSPLIELLSYFPSPGLLDEEITLFLGVVDAFGLGQVGGLAAEHEQIAPIRGPMDAALVALNDHVIHNGPLIVALQGLALNRSRLEEIVRFAHP
jgi:ADP-ribose pyrophosphatase